MTTSPTHTLPMTRSAAATETSHMPLTTSGTQRSSFIHMASNVSMPVLSVPSYTDVAKDKSPKFYSTCRSDGSGVLKKLFTNLIYMFLLKVSVLSILFYATLNFRAIEIIKKPLPRLFLKHFNDLQNVPW